MSLGWLPPVLLIAAVVDLAVWGFNSTLFRPGTQQAQPPAGSEAQDESAAAASSATPVSETVRLSVTTEPAGARVLVDAFPLEGLTPIVAAPVSARESRLVRVELEGYEPFEAPFDLTFDRSLSFVLQEASEPVATQDQDDGGAQPDPAAADGMITIAVSDESWLEIYPGTAREGTPLVYTTAGAGDSYTFDLPVFIRVGNAAGVSVTVNGRDLGPLGSAGEITTQAFTLDD